MRQIRMFLVQSKMHITYAVHWSQQNVADLSRWPENDDADGIDRLWKLLYEDDIIDGSGRYTLPMIGSISVEGFWDWQANVQQPTEKFVVFDILQMFNVQLHVVDQ